VVVPKESLVFKGKLLQFTRLSIPTHAQPQRHRLKFINPLNAELNPICPLLALLGAHHILHVSRIRVNVLCIMA
jgi:hypothetical protein